MGLIDNIDSTLALARAGMDTVRSGGDSAVVIADLSERLQSMREDLLTVRQEVTKLQEENLELEKRLGETADFESTRHQYAPKTLSTGTSVYVRRGSAHRNEEAVAGPTTGADQRQEQTPVYYCAHCFEQCRHTRLQPAELKLRVDTYSCHACGAKVLIPNDRRPPDIGPIRIKRNRFW